MTWLSAVHIVGVVMWAGGLVAVSRPWAARTVPVPPDAPSPALRRRRALYRLVVAPGAYIALLTGIWLLHQEHQLLLQRYIQGKLALIVLLCAADHLTMRSLWRRHREARERFPGPRALAAATAALTLGIVLLAEVRPWGKV